MSGANDSLPTEKVEGGLREALRSESWEADEVFGALDRLGESASRIVLAEAEEESGPVIAPASPADQRLSRGRSQYRVDGELARGGMGVVLKGHDTDLGRDVALKVMHPEFSARPESVQRFVEEAQIGGQLQHPGIVPVYELGLMADERPYFAMKLIKGRTLASLFADRESPAAEQRRFLGIFEQVCQTVAYAHARGVIHRDLKPSNVMVGSFGEVQVVDWGLAKVLPRGGVADEKRADKKAEVSVIETVRSEHGSSQSQAGSVMGTPAYMAPEQARGEVGEVTERADVFSLGAILCELLTGAPPYTGHRDAVMMQAAVAELQGAKQRLAECRADEGLVALALRCLAPAPVARPHNAAAVAQAVQAHLASVEDRAREARLEAERARARAAAERKARKLTAALAATVLFAIVGGGGGYQFVESHRQARRERVTGLVNEALNESSARRAEGELSAALAAAERARVLARSEDVEAGLRARVDEQVVDIENQVRLVDEQRARDARNDVFLARLDQVRTLERHDPLELGIESSIPWEAESFESFWERRDRAYFEVFAEFGIPVANDAITKIAESVRATGIGVEIALRLDDWARVVRRLEGEDSARGLRLLDIAHLCDPDPGRDRIRAAVASADVEELRRLADETDWSRAEPATLTVLAGGLDDAEAAIALLKPAQIAHPDDLILNVNLAGYYQKLSRHDLAARYLQAAVAGKPDSVLALERLSVSLRRLGEHDAATHAALRATELQPDTVSVWVKLALALEAKGDEEAMLEAYRQAHALAPEVYQHTGHLLRALFETGRHEEHLALALRSAEQHRQESEVQTQLAFAWHERGDHETELKHARRWLELDPEEAHAHLFVGHCLEELGRYEEAILAFELALEYGVSSETCGNDCERETLYGLGNAFLALDQVKGAEECYSELVETRPDDVHGWHGMGRLHLARGELDDALEVLGRAQEVAPKEPAVFATLGSVYHDRGEKEQAIEAYRAAVELRGAPSDLGNLALELREAGRLREALAAADEAIGTYPDYVVGYFRKAFVLFDLQRTEEALPLVEQILQRVGSAPPYDYPDLLRDAHALKGEAYERLGDLDAEVEAWRNAVRDFPNDAVLLHSLGDACNRAGHLDEAAEAWLESFHLEPGNEEVVHHIEHLTRAPVDQGLKLESLYALLEASPDDAGALNALAWELVLDPGGEGFDPEEAVELAMRATELAPEEGTIWNTLGLSLVRAERWDEAVEALENSIALSGQGEPEDWYFLAMAWQGSGDESRALDCYEQARALRTEELEAHWDREVRALLGLGEGE